MADEYVAELKITRRGGLFQMFEKPTVYTRGSVQEVVAVLKLFTESKGMTTA